MRPALNHRFPVNSRHSTEEDDKAPLELMMKEMPV
jgi:hypothetical protein